MEINKRNEITESVRKEKPQKPKTSNNESPWQLTEMETSTRNESLDS